VRLSSEALVILLLQIALVLVVARFVGLLAVRLGQPAVVGQMLAGVVLGPSVLGYASPEAYERLFSGQSANVLGVLSKVGVIFFLFLIGLEFDPKQLRGRGRATALIGLASVAVPFASGFLLTRFLYPRLFDPSTALPLNIVALFIGAAMSITAFPVLARILAERNMTRSSVGVVSLACAAFNDVVAWVMLAFIVALVTTDDISGGLRTLGLSLAYLAIIWLVVRPMLRRLETLFERSGGSAQAVLGVVLPLLLLSAAATEWIGIHALFGAFVLGLVIPHDTKYARVMTERLEDFTVAFLLPIFFAYAGLKTQVGLIGAPGIWSMTLLIIGVAVAGKFIGTSVVARFMRFSWRESGAMGVLMNTRGLVEIVIITIGLELGIINQTVFTMMFVMAVVTTAMTSPLLAVIYPRRFTDPQPIDASTAAREFGVLVPVSRPDSATGLASMLGMLTASSQVRKVYGLGLIPPRVTDAIGRTREALCSDALDLLARESAGKAIPFEPIRYATRDVATDIVRVARVKRVDLLLMGYHKPLIGSTILGGVVHRVLAGAECDVAVFVDRDLPDRPRVLVPFIGTPHDELAIDLAKRLVEAGQDRVTLLHIRQPGPAVALRQVSGMTTEERISYTPVDAVLGERGRFDLVILGVGEEWGLASSFIGLHSERIADEWAGSMLVVRRFVPDAAIA
jgi:Kef-type K+ transport system membrane component KefB/nucleotide-binding universal stress UspA family protein